jgi:hypothetical protein
MAEIAAEAGVDLDGVEHDHLGQPLGPGVTVPRAPLPPIAGLARLVPAGFAVTGTRP